MFRAVRDPNTRLVPHLVEWVVFYLINFHKLLSPIRELVTGFNKLLEEFISVIPALLNVKQFNLTAFFLRGRKMVFKGEHLGREHAW